MLGGIYFQHIPARLRRLFFVGQMKTFSGRGAENSGSGRCSSFRESPIMPLVITTSSSFLVRGRGGGEEGGRAEGGADVAANGALELRRREGGGLH